MLLLLTHTQHDNDKNHNNNNKKNKKNNKKKNTNNNNNNDVQKSSQATTSNHHHIQVTQLPFHHPFFTTHNNNHNNHSYEKVIDIASNRYSFYIITEKQQQQQFFNIYQTSTNSNNNNNNSNNSLSFFNTQKPQQQQTEKQQKQEIQKAFTEKLVKKYEFPHGHFSLSLIGQFPDHQQQQNFQNFQNFSEKIEKNFDTKNAKNSLVQVECASDLFIGAHVMMLCGNGDLYVRGSNAGGQLATRSTHDISEFTRICPTTQFLNNKNGNCRRNFSRVGENVEEEEEEEKVIKIATGCGHSLFLTNRGSLYSCGLSEFGQLGLGHLHMKISPTRIRFSHRENAQNSNWNENGDLSENDWNESDWSENDEVFIVDVQCGTDHTICLSSSGHVYGFGKNTSGQLGLDNAKQVYEHGVGIGSKRVMRPVRIPIVNNDEIGENDDKNGENGGREEKVRQIATMSDHCAFLTESGSVYMCGNNTFGQCGVQTTNHRDLDGNGRIRGMTGGTKQYVVHRPTRVQIPSQTQKKKKTKFQSVFCCEYSTVLVDEDNRIWMFGDNASQMIVPKRSVGVGGGNSGSGTENNNGLGSLDRDDHCVYDPTPLDIPPIDRKWMVQSVCSTYGNDEIMIMLAPSPWLVESLGRAMLQDLRSFGDITIGFANDST